MIEGLQYNIFLLNSGGTTDNPHHPDINSNAPINTPNRWARFVYQAMEILGPLGVHNWQVMNEVNTSTFWNNDVWVDGESDYVRTVEIVSKLIAYRQVPDKIILGGLAYQFDEITGFGLNPWGRTMFTTLNDPLGSGDFVLDALSFHPYDRNKTSYDFLQEAITYFEDEILTQLQEIPVWYTETGSNGCGQDTFSVPPAGVLICPPNPNALQIRSTDLQQRDYMIQSMAYAFSSPEVEKYFQFHLHDFCPYGPLPDTDPRYRPGFGLYHNWPNYEFFVGQGSNCSVSTPYNEPYNGNEKPAYLGFAQASRWLRDLMGYSEPVGGNFPVESLIFPLAHNQRTRVIWSRLSGNHVEFHFYPSQDLSGGPVLAIYPDGTKNVITKTGEGYYRVQLDSPTTPILSREDSLPIIGGKPLILLEHLLFDLGAKPPVFAPGEEVGIRFGLNLPAGIISQDTVEIAIYNENDEVVWTNSDTFSNGEHEWLWDGLDETTNDPVANGLYRYDIHLPSQNYTITGVVGVSQPGIRACFFNTSAPDPYPPSPSEAFIDYRGSAIYPEISFDWEGNPPIPELDDNDNWIARYVGYVQVDDAGMYQFRLKKTDDVARLFVNGTLILMPDWVENGGELLDFDSPGIYLSEGLHTIVVEHAQVTGLASLTLQWHKDGWIVPWWTVDALWQPGGGLTATCEATNGPVPFLNGDFEDGFNHWTQIPGPPTPVWGWHLNEYVTHGGQYSAEGSVHLEGDDPTYLISDPFTVTGNRCYKTDLFFQGYFDPAYEDALFHVGLNWYDGNGTLLSSSELLELPFSNIPANWYFFTGQATAPQGSEDAEIFFYLERVSRVQNSSPSGEGANIFVDDVVIGYCP